MPLTLLLNGHSRTFESLSDSATLDQLVVELSLKADRVAIELNGQIASRTTWPKTILKTNDRLEVVHFVGGGSPSSASRRELAKPCR